MQEPWPRGLGWGAGPPPPPPGTDLSRAGISSSASFGCVPRAGLSSPWASVFSPVKWGEWQCPPQRFKKIMDVKDLLKQSWPRVRAQGREPWKPAEVRT